ncbi:hypothetical protein KIN20_010440 [Parelaphostrongylus tenuis]|uniref:Uncharacterized protein n=1 Tax=Parelaphostrongylus tenuis TaxID=148309 RepID=A0AAD5QP54_PARTN|nr:hypothetical protein KIN20_010440 [Parelaphostrongylus tenuis]
MVNVAFDYFLEKGSMPQARFRNSALAGQNGTSTQSTINDIHKRDNISRATSIPEVTITKIFVDGGYENASNICKVLSSS